MVNSMQAIILAAGKSSRFKTGTTKLTEKICGQAMILYQTKLLTKLGISITVVVGHQKELLKKTIQDAHEEVITFVVQESQNGTGDAVKCTQSVWNNDHILIMNGDIPLLTADILQALYQKHITSNAQLSFVTAHDSNPNNSYGRVIHTPHGIEIVEVKHLADIQDYCCINAGIYVAKKEFLLEYIDQITCNPVTHEYYLTDLIKIASDKKFSIETVNVPFDHVRGVNTLEELWASEQVKRSELIRYWMHHGVRFTLAQNVHIDLDVSIGSGSHIYSGVQLFGKTKIGKNCTIGAFSLLENSTLEDESIVYSHSVISDSFIASGAQIGPFAHVKNKTHIDESVIIGNFVEIKKSTVKKLTKIKHLSYIGDAEIGEKVTVGAGTITANYNGISKQKTIIADTVLVGSNTTLIAPVTIESGSYIAAGSTITEDVPAGALAIARERQINKIEYAKKLLTVHEKNMLHQQEKHQQEKNDTSDSVFVGAVTTKKIITTPQK